MSSEWGRLPGRLRPWLILGRVSNLPTVWSNCLAAWLLAGGGPPARLTLLLLAGTFVYVAGMLLNDAVDAGFDREHRKQRPIPAGEVSRWSVAVAGMGLLAAGTLMLASLGPQTGALGLLLFLAILVYDVVHKETTLSPWIMALCRYLLFVAAGTVGDGPFPGLTHWGGLALAGYIVGLSALARVESTGGSWRHWALAGLAAPVVLAWLSTPWAWWSRAQFLVPLMLHGLWTLRCLAQVGRGDPGGLQRAVGGLLAGIPLVDLLLLSPRPWPWGVALAGCWALCLLLQRKVPAT